MKIVLATTVNNQLGGVFGNAFQQAGGPAIDVILVLGERTDLSYPLWAQGYVALKLFGPNGVSRLLRARYFPWVLSSRDRRIGIHKEWLPSIKTDTTTVIDELPSINSEKGAEWLHQVAPDVLISIGCPDIIKPHILEIPAVGALNVHNGRIPKYRGHFGTFWEVLNGETWAYVSIHTMAAMVDAGHLLAFERVDIRQTPSFLDLLVEKKQRGGKLLAQLLNDIQDRGSLPQAVSAPDGFAQEVDYFGWPSLSDMSHFSWRARKCQE